METGQRKLLNYTPKMIFKKQKHESHVHVHYYGEHTVSTLQNYDIYSLWDPAGDQYQS